MFANSGKPDKSQLSGPTAPYPDDFQMNPPPPSYEESIKMDGVSRSPQQYPTLFQQQQSITHTQFYAAPSTSSLSSGLANPYQINQQQQHFYNNLPTSPQSGISKSAANVLYLAKGAKIRTTTSGAVSIPPPPPGCAPTQGQIAAMCGQPVVIKKQKKSFF